MEGKAFCDRWIDFGCRQQTWIPATFESTQLIAVREMKHDNRTNDSQQNPTESTNEEGNHSEQTKPRSP